MSPRIQLFLTATLIVVTAAGAAADPVLGTGFVVAAEGATCQDTCTAVSQTAAFLNNFYTDASTCLCAANISDQGWVAGYQTTSPVCTTTYNGAATNATQYACLCLSSEQTPGLEPSTGAQSCEQTCATTLEGEVGTAVRTDQSLPSYACLPGVEAGLHNRFGYANDQTVSYTPGTVAAGLEAAAGVEPEEAIPCVAAGVSTTTTYSCFCTFEPQTPAATPATSSTSESDSVATAGRKLLL